jgi:hypothetical protein
VPRATAIVAAAAARRGLGQRGEAVVGLDRRHLGARRVVREHQPGAGADLDHRAAQVAAQRGPPRRQAAPVLARAQLIVERALAEAALVPQRRGRVPGEVRQLAEHGGRIGGVAAGCQGGRAAAAAPRFA